MSTTQSTHHLATRRSKNNPNHHLWNNNGTWWCHFTLHSTTGTKKRHRLSLKTPDLTSARRKRDRILSAIQAHSGRIAA
jgi:hypothetical protein